jgi:hypothetical protein
MNLREFLSYTVRNSWINFKGFHIYVRKGFHNVDGQVMLCFDIAHITQELEKNRGKGHFWNLITHLETTLPPEYEIIFVESVINDLLALSLLKHDFTQVPKSFPPSFYKRIHHAS